MRYLCGTRTGSNTIRYRIGHESCSCETTECIDCQLRLGSYCGFAPTATAVIVGGG